MHPFGCRQAWGLGSRYNRRRAAEKQKEEKGGIVFCYKQATPTGFEDLCAKQNLSKHVKIVGNAKN
jgi:hypothetical protein